MNRQWLYRLMKTTSKLRFPIDAAFKVPRRIRRNFCAAFHAIFCNIHVIFYSRDITTDRQMNEFYSDTVIYVHANSPSPNNTIPCISAALVYLYCCRSISPIQDMYPRRRKYPLGEKELNSLRSCQRWTPLVTWYYNVAMHLW